MKFLTILLLVMAMLAITISSVSAQDTAPTGSASMFSPDGSRILYPCLGSDGFIYLCMETVGFFGQAQAHHSANRLVNGPYSFSPDGSRIAYPCLRGDGFIYLCLETVGFFGQAQAHGSAQRYHIFQ